ncbi:MAG TPA: uracil-DNA glycosylase family protein [Candidatus Methylomirabilis sp.]|nr:uracil-DNA glycosylase family protein [Candidatus Methylomirabilis sp.]
MAEARGQAGNELEQMRQLLLAANNRFAQGDAAALKALCSHREDVTLFGGAGGYERGWEQVAPRYSWASANFSGGQMTSQVLATHVSTDLACTVELEHWDVRLASTGSMASIDLRVTHVYRREDGAWKVIHRHGEHLVGINPSLRSAEVGHHFASPGNPFWRLLNAARLVPEACTYEDDIRLPEWGLALTNIVARATRAASELTSPEYAAGRLALARLITRLKPRVVAFVGVTVYREFFRARAKGGPGPKPERIGTARVFVVPNPSGLNAAYPGFRDKLVWFRRLERYAARPS